MHHLVVKLLNAFEQIDKQEDDITKPNKDDLPSVLIFLPGIHEIEDLYACLTDLDLRYALFLIMNNFIKRILKGAYSQNPSTKLTFM